MMNNIKAKIVKVEDLQVPLFEELNDSEASVIVGGAETLNILNNIRTLRAQAREGTLETLEEMLEKLEEIVVKPA